MVELVVRDDFAALRAWQVSRPMSVTAHSTVVVDVATGQRAESFVTVHIGNISNNAVSNLNRRNLSPKVENEREECMMTALMPHA